MTDQPKRIQLRRVRGWRKPEGAIVVARPTKWGNPWTPIFEVESGRWFVTGKTPSGPVLMSLDRHCHATREAAVSDVVGLYRLMIINAAEENDLTPSEYLAELAGHDLACWCPLDQPCHADVLLELANS